MTSLDQLPRNRLLAEFSLWSADLANIGKDMARVDAFVDIYHLDVSDGHFSPAFLFFPDLVAALRKKSKKPFHVHLMVKDAVLLEQVNQFADAGSDLISVHAENANAPEALAAIAKRGLKSGIVLQVETPVAKAKPFVKDIAMLTLLGTRIGIKGANLDERATDRLREARAMISSSILLAADGGIREHTVPDLRKATADTVVMGSLSFGAPDLAARMAWIRGM